MNSDTSAIGFLRSTFTSSTPVPYAASSVVELEINKDQFHDFVKQQEQRYMCTFISKSAGDKSRKEQNQKYWETVYPTVETAEEREAKRLKLINSKAGRPSAVLSVVKKKIVEVKKKDLHIFQTYVCGRGIKRVTSKKTSYCGCTAKILATVLATADNKNIIKVTYQWEHVGHVPGSVEDLRTGPSSRYVSNFILEQVEKNMTWVNIKNMIRLDKSVLIKALEQNDVDTVPLTMGIKYQDVYYALKKAMEKKAYFDKDFKKSIELWGQKIVNDPIFKGYFYSKNLETFEHGMFLVAFMSKWQLDVCIYNIFYTNMHYLLKKKKKGKKN